MDDLIQVVRTWGRQHSGQYAGAEVLVRDNKHTRFSGDFTKDLTQHLRRLATIGHPTVTGNRHEGYELFLETGECIGVSNANDTKQFHVYYRTPTLVSIREAEARYQKLAVAEAA